MSATRTHGLARRADTLRAPIAERILHDAILAGVISDHGERSSRLQAIAERVERPLEAPDLVVHGDTHRLKEPSEIAGTGARPERASDGANEIVARREWPV